MVLGGLSDGDLMATHSNGISALQLQRQWTRPKSSAAVRTIPSPAAADAAIRAKSLSSARSRSRMAAPAPAASGSAKCPTDRAGGHRGLLAAAGASPISKSGPWASIKACAASTCSPISTSSSMHHSEAALELDQGARKIGHMWPLEPTMFALCSSGRGRRATTNSVPGCRGISPGSIRHLTTQEVPLRGRFWKCPSVSKQLQLWRQRR